MSMRSSTAGYASSPSSPFPEVRLSPRATMVRDAAIWVGPLAAEAESVQPAPATTAARQSIRMILSVTIAPRGDPRAPFDRDRISESRRSRIREGHEARDTTDLRVLRYLRVFRVLGGLTHESANWRRGPRLRGRHHPGPDQVSRLDRRLVGRAVLASEGLHSCLHHRARLHGEAEARVRQTQREDYRAQRRPGR